MKAVIYEIEPGYIPKTLSITCESEEEYDYLTNLMSLTYEELNKVILERIDLGQPIEALMPAPETIHAGEPLTAIRLKKGH